VLEDDSLSQKILIVEDEPKLGELLSDYLNSAGMESNTVMDGDEAVDAVNRYLPDLVLLDLMLPNKDGLSICKELRTITEFQNLPIIITTAKVEEIDRLLGLELGADDYICKPYSPREVVARVKAVLRRTHYSETIHVGLSLDHGKMKALLNGKDLQLTAIEYTLLKLMYETQGQIYSRSQLMDHMYQDYRVVSDRTIDSHIKKLRQKISSVDVSANLIHSVYGVGYKFEVIDT
jgi:two-component system response regulator BaeR